MFEGAFPKANEKPEMRSRFFFGRSHSGGA
jgi:hypothetical protein